MRTETRNRGWGHLGIVAGGGILPQILAWQACDDGKSVSVAVLDGFADQDWDGFSNSAFKLDEIAAISSYFKASGVDAITFAGNVQRPDFETFDPEHLATSGKASLHEAARQGDDTLLRRVILMFEDVGFSVIGVADIAPDYLVHPGVIGNQKALNAARADCQRASEIARKIGALDIGQGAVVCRGLVLAVEAQEGTENMLARCQQLPGTLRGSVKNRSGVFAKWAKPGQDRRIDLPVIGVATIKAAASAGLAGLVLEANAVILLEPEAIGAAIKQHGLFMLGIEAEG